MPQIHFAKNHQTLSVETGAPLMKSLLDAGIPVASSCLGDGVCSKCKVRVVNGAENLSLETEDEAFLREKNSIPNGFRISCQVRVLGNVTIDTSYW